VSTSPLRAVLFDWDGTLADSAECSYRCYVKVFEAFGKSFGRDDFERTYSPNWHRTYVAMGVPEDRWTEADSIWLRHYAQDEAGLLPGARAALDRLRAAGLAQGLVTSGERERIERELARHGLDGFFAAIVCGGEVPNRKPHPEALVVALERLGVAPAEAAYVGDSPEDIEMSRAAGVFAVGIPGGFPNQAALSASKPDLVARDLDEAVAALLAGGGPLVA
jgi:HAD superfamily hydrolase (TIGR01549 family)